MTVTDDPVAGLHRRFDTLESNFQEVRKEQHQMATGLVTVDRRIDIMEVQIEAAQQREKLVVGGINMKLDANTSLIQKSFDLLDKHSSRFDAHTEAENRDRKKLLFWLITTVGSVMLGVAGVVITRVFGA